MIYLGWQDDNPKTIPARRVADAAAAYARRFGRPPTVALVNEAQICAVEGIAVRSEGYIRRNNFWVGCE